MTSPDHLRPEGTQVGTTVGPYYQNADPNAIGAGKNSEMNGLLGIMQNNFFFQVLGGFTSAISAVADGITAIVEAITGIFGGNLNDLNDWAESVRDGQLDLNNRVDLLSPLQDYGSSYAGNSSSIWNQGKIPYINQIGPMRNCHLASGGIVMDEKGLWDVRARIWINDAPPFVGGWVNWEIRIVKDSDGSQFHATWSVTNDASMHTSEINTSVVIPDAGYRAEVWVTNLGPGREIRGGPSRSRLTVQHISRSTTNPI